MQTLFELYFKAETQTVGEKTVISCLRWYASGRYGLLNTVGGDFSQTAVVLHFSPAVCFPLFTRNFGFWF